MEYTLKDKIHFIELLIDLIIIQMDQTIRNIVSHLFLHLRHLSFQLRFKIIIYSSILQTNMFKVK